MRYWEKPTLQSEDVRFGIYFIGGMILIWPALALFILTLGWVSPGKLCKDCAYWAVHGSWPK